MYQIGTVFLAALFAANNAWACIGKPPRPFSLRGSTFTDVDLRLGDGAYGSGLLSDTSQVSYNVEKKAWCIVGDANKPNEVQCLNAETAKNVKIKLKNAAGVHRGTLQLLDRSAYVWSIDAKGEIDKSKPFLEIRDQSRLTEISRDGMCRAADCPRIKYNYAGSLKVVAHESANSPGLSGQWSYTSGAVGNYESLNGPMGEKPAQMQYHSIYRSAGQPPQETDRLEITGNNITSGGCGKTTMTSYSPQQTGGPDAVRTVGRGG